MINKQGVVVFSGEICYFKLEVKVLNLYPIYCLSSSTHIRCQILQVNQLLSLTIHKTSKSHSPYSAQVTGLWTSSSHDQL